MIISASRRTDIPAFYAPWFLNRLGEGHVLVPNPFNPRSVSRVSLRPDAVDCIVFWTKNPAPMLPRLGELNGFKYYFQFTLNPYGKDIERNLPSIEERIETIPKTFRNDRKRKSSLALRPDSDQRKPTTHASTAKLSPASPVS